MVVAGLWGMSGAQLPGVEIGIAVSVVILGLAIALRATPPLAAGAAACAIFAIFHGHAHGAELPEGASSLGYALGFVDRFGPATLADAPRDLPRMEVRGDMTLDQFAAMMEAARA